MDNNNNISFEDLTGTSPSSQAPKKQNNGFAIASMVLGIISVLCCCIDYVSIVIAVIAIVFFAVDRKTNGKSSGMAIAGLVLGIFGIASGVLSIFSSIILNNAFPELESIYNSMFESLYGETGVF